MSFEAHSGKEGHGSELEIQMQNEVAHTAEARGILHSRKINNCAEVSLGSVMQLIKLKIW